jgi:hypothetical protein
MLTTLAVLTMLAICLACGSLVLCLALGWDRKALGIANGVLTRDGDCRPSMAPPAAPATGPVPEHRVGIPQVAIGTLCVAERWYTILCPTWTSERVLLGIRGGAGAGGVELVDVTEVCRAAAERVERRERLARIQGDQPEKETEA